MTGQFENFIESAYGYNHLLTISAAVALFYVFKNREERMQAGPVRTENGKRMRTGSVGGEKGEQALAERSETMKRSDGRLAGLICGIAPCSFGVYLLHEQVNVRYLWPFWLGADRCDSAFSLLWHWAAAILTVMVIGLAVDYIRGLLFRGIGKLLAGGRLDRGLRKIDDMVNGVMR